MSGLLREINKEAFQVSKRKWVFIIGNDLLIPVFSHFIKRDKIFLKGIPERVAEALSGFPEKHGLFDGVGGKVR